MIGELLENESVQQLYIQIVKSIMDESSEQQTSSPLKDIFTSDLERQSELKKIKPRRKKTRKKRKQDFYSDSEWGSDEEDQPPRKRPALENNNNEDSEDPILFSDSESPTERSIKNYQLRPRLFLRRPLAKRENLEEERLSPEIFTRGRGRVAHLSKYRRRTANARERHRMKEINAAFATLRGVLPRPFRVKESTLTKIMTLRMAVEYIHTLDGLLNDEELCDKSYCSGVEISNDPPPDKIPTDSDVVSFEQMVLQISSATNAKCKDHASNDSADIDNFPKISDQCSFSYVNPMVPGSEILNIEEDPIALLLSGDVVGNIQDILSSD